MGVSGSTSVTNRVSIRDRLRAYSGGFNVSGSPRLTIRLTIRSLYGFRVEGLGFRV